MTDLKALRREIAEEVCRNAVCAGEPHYIESALLQYAEACLGEPSEEMIDEAYHGGRACNMCISTLISPGKAWADMASQRLKEIK